MTCGTQLSPPKQGDLEGLHICDVLHLSKKRKRPPIFGGEKRGKAQKIDHPIPYHHQQNLLGILTMPSIFVVISEVENKKITKNLEETGKSPNFADGNDDLI